MQLSPPPSQVNMSRGHFNPPSHRVEKVGSMGEHAPGTPKVFPRNTQVKKFSISIASQRCKFIIRVEKSVEHREHAPGTPKVFPRNTQGRKQSKRCFDSVSGHMFCEYSLIYQYFPSCACSTVLRCLIVKTFAPGMPQHFFQLWPPHGR